MKIARRLKLQIFRYAIATGRATRNLSADLRGALTPVKGKNFEAMTEPDKIADLLLAIDQYPGNFIVQCALKLAPLFFVRPGELRTAKWADINFDTAEWRYTTSKTKTPHIVPLATQATAILKELHPLTGHGIYVFPSIRTPNGSRPMSDIEHQLAHSVRDPNGRAYNRTAHLAERRKILLMICASFAAVGIRQQNDGK